ncbi:predicted protein [Thalassiosira pseudonana CCMP1335]|uniref:Uncharacterized protein n=1 Tax=Thalassiosira pseudonana TaxID=35128 RepID=B8BVW1_THAPS|nr:predicted protein [Thalassiosira pseudonana CCMP1335]EED95009.1 predicted protein [Thalassiosira pseudonana CCMP1335]|eukprot:g9688.t1 g9688   contig4:342623-343555(-)
MAGSGNSPVDEKLQLQIFDRFSKIVKDKFTSYGDGTKVSELDTLYKRPEFSAEKQILNDMNSFGMSKGIMSGIACFAFLRWSPGVISRYMMRKRSGVGSGAGFGSDSGAANPFTQSGYKLDPPKPSMGYQGSASESSNFVIRGLRLGLDIFVSLSVGAYASLLFLDKDKMMHQFSEIPLVQGRSLISEELCHDFSAEFQKYNPNTWDKNHPALSGSSGMNDEKSDFVGLIEGFVANCKRREIYEGELRREQGLREDEPVIVPSPGVPRDISVTLNDLLTDKIAGSEDNNDDGDFYYDKYFDENEVQEETD